MQNMIQTQEHNNGNGHSSVRLPKLTIEPFFGDSLRWQQFQDSFNTSVHQNQSISDVEKWLASNLNYK